PGFPVQCPQQHRIPAYPLSSARKLSRKRIRAALLQQSLSSRQPVTSPMNKRTAYIDEGDPPMLGRAFRLSYRRANHASLVGASPAIEIADLPPPSDTKR